MIIRFIFYFIFLIFLHHFMYDQGAMANQIPASAPVIAPSLDEFIYKTTNLNTGDRVTVRVVNSKENYLKYICLDKKCIDIEVIFPSIKKFSGLSISRVEKGAIYQEGNDVQVGFTVGGSIRGESVQRLCPYPKNRGFVRVNINFNVSSSFGLVYLAVICNNSPIISYYKDVRGIVR